ncbi:hypothetical protein QZH41_006389 [Actinostola sp. cb2023]|nr:hypothetical protein QZH41_006389 [Actinostola sp. cb2023]
MMYELILTHSKFLEVIMDEKTSHQEAVLSLVVAIAEMSPECCQHSHLPVLFAAYNASLSKSDSEVDCRKFVERGGLGYTVAALSSRDEPMRKAASHVLSRYLTHLEASSFREKKQKIYKSYIKDDRLRLWDSYTGKNTLVNFGRINNPSHKSIQCATTVGHSTDIVFVPSSGSIEVFDIHSGSKVNTLVGHYSNVNCCTFQQNFQVLFSGSNDCQLLSWFPNMEHDRPCINKDAALKADVDSKNDFNPYQDTWSSDED